MTLISRRSFVRAGSLLLAGSGAGNLATAQIESNERGAIVGEPTAEKEGLEVLRNGGNVIDAIVTAALAAAIASPSNCGIGGYGMSATFAIDGGKKIVCIDGNSTAPAAMTRDIFRPDASGKVRGGMNDVGWLSAGVPGTLAGLELALKKFGTWSFADVVQPAIRLAGDGISLNAGAAAFLRREPLFASDPGSRRLYSNNGSFYAAGEKFRNVALAEMLSELARQNSVESFYRGAIATAIADAFQQNGGLVTAQDLADYQPIQTEALQCRFGEYTLATAPPTAGGLTILQILKCLDALHWNSINAPLQKTHAWLEAHRLAWHDRLELLGDPAANDLPVTRLLSDDYAMESAEKVRAAATSGKMLSQGVPPARKHSGTIHLSAADSEGNLASLTLTHGNAFGACVTVDALGLTLGHGMSRFDPRPDHPNSPGPGKRPLHNMVPSIVMKNGFAVAAIGGTGGRRIPNSAAQVLARMVLGGDDPKAAIMAPRFHTEGDDKLMIENSWPADEVAGLRKTGYTVTAGGSATISMAGRTDSGGFLTSRR